MIENLLKQINQNLDNPEWLSQTVVQLGSLLFNHNTDMANAELQEKRVAIQLIDQTLQSGNKRMSVAEAEKRAVVTTNNRYGVLKAQGEAITETINAIKARLRILEWERNRSNQP